MGKLRGFKDHLRRTSAKLGSTIHFGVFAFMLAVTMPRLLRSFSPTWDPLDTSWAWMLGYALQHHLQWGKSIVFTYGPLGFLTHSYFYSDHALWALSATIRLISWFGLGLGFACILRRLAPDDKPFQRTIAPVAIGWVIGASFIHLSSQSAVLGVMLLVLAITEEESTAVVVELALSGSLLALGALIKSTALLVSLFALLAHPTLWWYAGRRKSALHLSLPLFSFLVSFCALWLASSQSFADLPAYLHGTWALASGYTPAMSLTGMLRQVLSAFLILFLFAGVLIGFCIRGSKPREAQCLLLSGLAFWAWKEGFTLQDWGYFRHPMTFYGTALLIGSAGIALVSAENSRYLKACVYGAYAVALLSSALGYPTLSLSCIRVLDNYENYLTLMLSESRRTAEERTQTIAIQRQFKIPSEVLDAVGNASVNVLPWSLMIVQGYGMRLDASPIIQTYSAYTPYLDRTNARQLWDGGGADKIIYTYRSFDRRYPPFSEPATFRAILSCYQTEYPGNPYAVLSQVPCVAPEMTATDRQREDAFGEWITVPPQASYAEIRVRTNMRGHIANILYKANDVLIYLRLANGSVKGPYRFIYPVAEDGLFVRYFIGSQSDATLLFSGNAVSLQRITAIKIATNPYPLDYSQHFGVRFFDESPPHRSRPGIPPSGVTTSSDGKAVPERAG